MFCSLAKYWHSNLCLAGTLLQSPIIVNYTLMTSLRSAKLFDFLSLVSVSTNIPHNKFTADFLLTINRCRGSAMLGQWVKCPQTSALPLECNMLFDELTSAYRCKKERSVAFKIRQNVFLGPAGGAHDYPHTPSRLRMGHPSHIPHPTQRLDFHAFDLAGREHCAKYFSIGPPDELLQVTVAKAR